MQKWYWNNSLMSWKKRWRSKLCQHFIDLASWQHCSHNIVCNRVFSKTKHCDNCVEIPYLVKIWSIQLFLLPKDKKNKCNLLTSRAVVWYFVGDCTQPVAERSEGQTRHWHHCIVSIEDYHLKSGKIRV